MAPPPLIHLDTHVLAWLYEPLVDRFSSGAREALNEGDLAVSPIALLELTFLKEIGRLTVDGAEISAALGERIGLRTDDTDLVAVVDAAHGMSWTRDPFGRMIAAHALAAGARLLSADGELREQVPDAIW